MNSVTGKISRLQKAAMRIMTFSEFRAHSEPLFKKLEILKFQDSITQIQTLKGVAKIRNEMIK